MCWGREGTETNKFHPRVWAEAEPEAEGEMGDSEEEQEEEEEEQEEKEGGMGGCGQPIIVGRSCWYGADDDTM